MDDKVIVDLLGQVGNLFTSSLDLKENIDFMLRAAGDLVSFDAATVFLVDEGDKDGLSAIATYPYAEDLDKIARFAMGEGIVGWAAANRRVVSVSDAKQDKRFKSLPDSEHDPRSYLVLPLESPRHLVGAMTMSRRDVRPFTTLEQALMQIIVNQAAISIDNARLYNQQRQQLQEIDSRKRELEVANAQINEISRLKSEFLANMSHELRTPLNAILGFSEILKDNLVELAPAQRQECLENIYASGKHLLELVNDVLDLSKIEAGRMELSYDDFYVANAIREVHNVIRSLSERRDIDFKVDVDDEIEIRADKSKFKQVLYNLLSNAIKFTDQGGKVWLDARLDGEWVEVDVGDTGVGIPKDQQERIFSEFYQVESRQSREVEGTGLGLSLTKRLVELHGGTISVSSEAGKGAIFTVRIPHQGISVDDQPRNRILLVEDNPINRELAIMVLSGSGYQVDVAVDGEEGLHKARSSIYDLVLMDIKLPGIDGLTVTRMLKADPQTSGLPIIALTANAMKGDEKAAIAAGCEGYITKPIEVGTFVQQISGILEAKAS